MRTAWVSGSRAIPENDARPLTAQDYVRARRFLLGRDPVLAAAIKRIGPCRLAERQRRDHLTALVGAVVSQQLSTKAAATIFGRFTALFENAEIPGVAAVARLDDETLRRVGLSRQKIGYLRDLCARIVDGRLQLGELDTLADDEVVDRLVAVRGFGRWTAQMFLMFRLHRPDVLPVDDLGLVNAVQRLYGLRKRPESKVILKIGEKWRPYRSVACWYLWQTLRTDLNFGPSA
jgi:DNA-3-methyladenine glycosylase II